MFIIGYKIKLKYNINTKLMTYQSLVGMYLPTQWYFKV